MKEYKIGLKIKELRLSKGYSQEELATKAGINIRTIQRIENSESTPMGDTVRRIAESLNVRADEILQWNLTRNRAYEILLILCLLLSPLPPFVFGLIVAVIMWVMKKNEYVRVDYLGRKLISFELTFLLLFGILFIVGLLLGFVFGSDVGTFIEVLNIVFITIIKSILVIINAIYYYYKDGLLFLPRFRFFA